MSPAYLFADSQLLFWERHGEPFLKTILSSISDQRLCAAYIGASNGDKLEYFDIFHAAMTNIGVHETFMVKASFTEEDRANLHSANIILLAGGDVGEGWKIFQASGLMEAILEKYRSNAVLIGTSAGAIQLGICEPSPGTTTNLFQVVPYVIDVHQDKTGWADLKTTLLSGHGYGTGLGISCGAGLIYHPDHTVEPIRSPLHEFSLQQATNSISSDLLLPSPR